ncbi:DUF6392 family protein [Photorhabdus caribbeanensis]
MFINIEALVNCLGKHYQEIFYEELISYKTNLSGFGGDSMVCLYG